MMSTTQTATRTMEIIHRCICTLAAETPKTAAETLAALRTLDTPAAYSVANLVSQVAAARHGKTAIERAERR